MRTEGRRTSVLVKENILLGSSMSQTGSNSVTKRRALGEYNNNIPSRSAFGVLSKQKYNKKTSVNEKNLEKLRNEPSTFTHIDEWTDGISRMLTGSNIMNKNTSENCHHKLKKGLVQSHIFDSGKDVSQHWFRKKKKKILQYDDKQQEKHPIKTNKKKLLTRKGIRNKEIQMEGKMEIKHTITKRYRCVDPIAEILNHSENFFEGKITGHQITGYENSNAIEDTNSTDTYYETSIAALPIFTQKLEDTVEVVQRSSIKKPVAFYPSKCNMTLDGAELDFSFVI